MAQADLSVRRGCMADVALYWRGLRLFWEPRGRSTRTEVAMLLLLPLLVGAPFLLMARNLLIGTPWLGLALYALYLVPLPAASARRFHDMGKSGWLALPLLALVGVVFWNGWLSIAHADPASADLWHNRQAQEFIFRLICSAYLVGLLLPPEPGINRHGPNPRPPHRVI